MSTPPAAPASPAAPSPAPQPPAAAVEPPRPGWTTSEFWTTALVHLTSLIATILVVLGRGDDGLQAEETAIPAIALIISGLASYGYARSRIRLKLNRIATFAHGLSADVAHISPVLDRDARALEPVLETLDPAAVARLKAAADAWHGKAQG